MVYRVQITSFINSKSPFNSSILSELTAPFSLNVWHDLDSYLISIKTLASSSPLDSKKTYEAISKLLRYSSNPSSYPIAPDEDGKLYHLLND